MYLSLFSCESSASPLGLPQYLQSNQAVRVLYESAQDHGKLHGSNVIENVSLNTCSDCPTHVSIAIAIWEAILWLILTFSAQNFSSTLRSLMSTAMSASAEMVTVKYHGIRGGLAGAYSTDGALSDTTTAPAPVHGMCISIISIKCVCI